MERDTVFKIAVVMGILVAISLAAAAAFGVFDKDEQGGSSSTGGSIPDATNNDILQALQTLEDKSNSALNLALEAKEQSGDNEIQLFTVGSDASRAISDAQNAKLAADAAQLDADTAISDAATADSKAVSAQSDATQALANASQAGTAAATADSKAVSAQSDATQALTNASQAGTAASAAQSDATQALAEVNRDGDYFSAGYEEVLTKTSASNTDAKLPTFKNTDTNMTVLSPNQVLLNEGKRYLITVSVNANWPPDTPHNTYMYVYLRYPGVSTFGLFNVYSKDSFYKYAGGQTMSTTVMKDTTGLSQAARTLETVFSMDFTTRVGDQITLAQGTRIAISEVK